MKKTADTFHMKKIRLPNPAAVLLGGFSAFWLADIINPGFNPIGIMVLMLAPVLIIEMLYPQTDLEDLVTQAKHEIENQAEKETVLSDLLDDEIEKTT